MQFRIEIKCFLVFNSFYIPADKKKRRRNQNAFMLDLFLGVRSFFSSKNFIGILFDFSLRLKIKMKRCNFNLIQYHVLCHRAFTFLSTIMCCVFFSVMCACCLQPSTLYLHIKSISSAT